MPKWQRGRRRMRPSLPHPSPNLSLHRKHRWCSAHRRCPPHRLIMQSCSSNRKTHLRQLDRNLHPRPQAISQAHQPLRRIWVSIQTSPLRALSRPNPRQSLPKNRAIGKKSLFNKPIGLLWHRQFGICDRWFRRWGDTVGGVPCGPLPLLFSNSGINARLLRFGL